MAVNQTTYYNLKYYKEVEGANETFLSYRLNVSGGSIDTNLYVLDEALHQHDLSITALEGKKQVYPFDVTYNVGTGYYEADISSFGVENYETRMMILVKPNVTSVGAVSITITNFLANQTKEVNRISNTGTYVVLGAGDFIANSEYLCIYDPVQTEWVLVGTTKYDAYVSGGSSNFVSISVTNSLEDSGYSASGFAPSTKGVTYGDAHDHSTNGTGGGTISYASLSNKPALPANHTANSGSFITAYESTNGTFSSSEVTWNNVNKTTSSIADITTKSHTSLTDIGTNSHSQIDTHISGNQVHGINAGSIVVGTNDTQTLTNKSFFDSNTVFVNSISVTKEVRFSLSGATAGTNTTMAFSQTANRTITFPDSDTTLVGTNNVQTITNKVMVPRFANEANNSATNITINTDLYDAYSITALAVGTNITVSGVANNTNLQKLIVRIKDSGAQRSIGWNSSYFINMGASLPTITTASKVTTVGFLYDSSNSKWGCVANVTEV